MLVVHGHTPIPEGFPDLLPNRLNLDTGACFGGPLTAAVFCEEVTEPLAFITDDGTVTELKTRRRGARPSATRSLFDLDIQRLYDALQRATSAAT